MSEQEMQQEIERLSRELAAANKSRERLREILFAVWPVDPPDVMEKQIEEMMKQPRHGIGDILADLLGDEPDAPQPDLVMVTKSF